MDESADTEDRGALRTVTEGTLSVSLEAARRLLLTKQHLHRTPLPRSRTEAIVAVIRDLCYVQWDPVSIVAPSHLLSLWSRIEGFRPSDLERLLWKEKRVFEHWTPIASLVLTEDFPLYHSLMRRYPDSLSDSWGAQREHFRRFLTQHQDLARRILGRLKQGPARLSDFVDHSRTKRDAGEWEPASDVSAMLFHLGMRGDVMVVGHEGAQNLWGLARDFLPDWVDRREMPEEEFEREAAQRALRALGIATARDIHFYFVRGRYHHLNETLGRLEAEGVVQRAEVEGVSDRKARYVHRADVRLLDSLGARGSEPRMTLLPPFDNLLGNPDRTNRLFGFAYVREQFLPREKRRFGTYVLPILWGDRLIGRIDPRLDRAKGELVVQSVHAEPGAPRDRAVSIQLKETIDRLAEFVGARQVHYTGRVPAAWKSALP